MKINNKGFTLIELLATMVILSIIMVVAVPNVMGILNGSRANTYVEDAKKLISLAEYEIRATPSLRPDKNACTALTLSYLDDSELDNAPNGGAYESENSYVIVVNKPTAAGKNRYVYYVTLDERLENGSHRGIKAKSYDDLYSEDSNDLVINSSGVLGAPTSVKGTVGCTGTLTTKTQT